MANIKSAIKRARQNDKRRVHNHYYKTTARTFVKQAFTQIEEGELEEAQTTTRKAIKALDKAAQKGIIHPKNAARRKSRLVKAFNKASATS